jgi:hypothetical protein
MAAMKKSDLLAHFGGSRQIADLLGITIQAVHQWPENLPVHKIDQIVGAAYRQNRLQDLPPIVID